MTILMGFAAINTGNNLIFLLVSFLLAIMGISGFYGLKNINDLSATVGVPNEVYAGRETFLTIELTNQKKWMPSMLLWVGVNDQYRLVNFIGANRSETVKLGVKFDRRGVHLLETVIVASRYPFNFFIRKGRIHVSESVLVFPEPQRCTAMGRSISNSRQMGDSVADNLSSREELSGIREYVAGDKIRDIHWKHFARSATLKTKEYSGQSVTPVMIALEDLQSESVEESLRMATFLFLEFFKSGIPAGLKLNKDVQIKPDIGTKHKIKMLSQLANHD